MQKLLRIADCGLRTEIVGKRDGSRFLFRHSAFRILHSAVLISLVFLYPVSSSARVSEAQIQKALKGKPVTEAQTALKAMDQREPWVLYYRAQLERDADTAIEYYKAIVQIDPKHQLADDALFEVANYHYALGRYTTAAKAFQTLGEAFPKSELAEKACYWQAACCLATQQPDAARLIYEQYLGKYSSLNEWVQLGIGDSYFMEKEYQQALRAYQMLLNSYPATTLAATACYRISECYSILGRDDRAQEFLDIVKSRYPSSFYGVTKKDTMLYTPPPPTVKKADTSKTTIPATSTATVAAAAHRTTSPAPAAAASTTTSATPVREGGFVIQVGSFSSQSAAQTLQKKLNTGGYPTEISVQIRDAKQLYRVWVGPFLMKDSARAVAEELKQKENLDYYILSK
jgi:tetratricopeptide (TPR) repeat protein